MDRCRPDRGIARQYAAPRQKITGPYFHLPDLLHRGAEVTVVELKDIQLSDTMKRAMARQAEAELEKRAKIINAEGESLAAATASGTAMS
jgi:regulator of protease activity HflC (stomatin/prohibitin superfamily)